jgi:hypothetical protein
VKHRRMAHEVRRPGTVLMIMFGRLVMRATRDVVTEFILRVSGLTDWLMMCVSRGRASLLKDEFR